MPPKRIRQAEDTDDPQSSLPLDKGRKRSKTLRKPRRALLSAKPPRRDQKSFETRSAVNNRSYNLPSYRDTFRPQCQPCVPQPAQYQKAHPPALPPPSERLTSRALDKLNVLNGQQPSSRRSMPSSRTQTIKTRDSNGAINAYDKYYYDELRRRNIQDLNAEDTLEANDFSEFVAAINKDRASPEPDERETEVFKKRQKNPANESTAREKLVRKVIQLDKVWDGADSRTIVDQVWCREMRLPEPSGESAKITTPQPDYTIGFNRDKFSAYDATAITDVKEHAVPAPSTDPKLIFPCLTVEAKGIKGDLQNSLYQSYSDGAHMLWNMSQLVEMAGEKPTGPHSSSTGFFGNIRAVTIPFTTSCVAVCYHWAGLNTRGDMTFYVKEFRRWTLDIQNQIQHADVYRGVRNACDYVLDKNRAWLDSALGRVQDGLRNPGKGQRNPNIPTPPTTHGQKREAQETDLDDSDDADELSIVLSTRKRT